MELQVSHSVYAKIKEKDFLWAEKNRDWKNIERYFRLAGSFWCHGYYVDTVGKNEKKIVEYVENQLKEDMMYDPISIKEYKDPFNGS